MLTDLKTLALTQSNETRTAKKNTRSQFTCNDQEAKVAVINIERH